MFQPKEDKFWKSSFGKEGGHYNIYWLKDSARGMEAIKEFFPDGTCNQFNIFIPSTSGVHGMYTTLDELEASIKKYGFQETEGMLDDPPDDWVRIARADAKVTLEDIPYLRKLAASSTKALAVWLKGNVTPAVTAPQSKGR
jgi:hypothetical protein